MIGPFFRAFAAACLLAFASSAGQADVGRVNMADPVEGHADVTYLDLVRLMFPDVASGENFQHTATPSGDLRHIDEDFGDLELETGSFFGAEAGPIKSGGKDRVVVLVDFGSSAGSLGVAILGLFGFDSGRPVLLDAVNVALDRDTFFRDGVLRLSDGETALVTASYHHNSSQGYAALALMLVRNDRVEVIDTIWLISNRWCGYEQVEEPKIAVVPDTGMFGDIVATVTDTVTIVEEETCGDTERPPPSTTEYKVTYTWDEAAQKYLPNSDAFERLAAVNEDRY